MAISSDTKSLTPEELPADNTPAETPADKEPSTRETLDEVISVSPDESNPAVLDPEEGTAETLPDSEEYEQILEELRNAKTEQAVSARRNRKLTLDKVTFGITGAIAVVFVVWGFVGRDSLSETSKGALNWVMEYTGWLFMVLASLFVIFVLWLALGKFGNIPLGKDGEKPEFRTISWVAMMFAAGMGIGLMFYGVAEPLFHYISPPPGTVDGRTPDAIQTAMATSIFHWTLHPWAMYAVVGIAMAYGTYRLGRKQLVSAAFTSLFGIRMVEGPLGKFINILAIFATLFGTAASLGLGALQIGSGLTSNGWMGEVGTPVLVVIVAILTFCFVASAVSGISRGIQWLSNINMVLAVVLALIVFVAGPTLFILNLIPSAVGDYARDLAEMSSRTEAVGDDALRSWMTSWTIFYWAWWISWTPFVGLFIARISRGRTIRQFVTGVLLVPSIVSVIWFCIFGGAAFHVQQEADKAGTPGLVTMVDGAPSINFDGALFDLVKNLGMPEWLTVGVIALAMVLVAIFFVTGADAASIVMGSLSSNGAEHPRRGVVIFWGTLTGAVAAVMLLAGGDEPSEALSGLQRVTIVAALPFILVMLLLCFALAKDLRRDPLSLRRRLATSVVERAIRTGVEQHRGVQFDLVTKHECAETCPDSDCPGGTPTGSIPTVDSTPRSPEDK
ncbi:BCCT family transporter [Paenarthrobacter ureafaciens]|uniref:BCCT family transporter n=1 Tax=Paenarthrobacter ureafaciens TaxID=37931 RepID=UPI000397BAC4|nr:BCCT family transporter [Paenarthrobacter ureafaciens]AOY72976.1 choline transporter [Arthrobacter sp. ZXY-2]GLU61339.1 choline transporter [Paenarthrobacter ureafaciens]GLU65601.1 choline transporter [Paenarthrobacter ureafaciens]GLU69922.1 choline transporter [Paenarthrobacter ureafaciens]GLU74161.1 choline transporter [Paenarthrobacter ureafaciens]